MVLLLGHLALDKIYQIIVKVQQLFCKIGLCVGSKTTLRITLASLEAEKK